MQARQPSKTASLALASIAVLSAIAVAVLFFKSSSFSNGWLGKVHLILTKVSGITRAQAAYWFEAVIELFAGLAIAVILIEGRSLWRSMPLAVWSARHRAIGALFEDGHAYRRAGYADYLKVVSSVAFFALLFSIMLSKNIRAFTDYFDSRWHKAMLDYDLDWGTPAFSLSGNILTQFGMQPPLNGSLSPLNGLAHLVKIDYRIASSVTLFYLAVVILLWFFGKTIGLRPLSRIVLGGIVGLMVTIPFGLEHLIPFDPPLLLTANFILTHYWLEAGILCLSAVLLFFWLGQYRSYLANIGFAAGFALIVFDLLLSFPAATFFVVPVMALYGLAFLVTAESRREFWCKLATGAVLVLTMLVAHLPTFIINLYAYCFGPYFAKQIENPGTLTLMKSQTMVWVFGNDWRVLFIFAAALGSAVVLAMKGQGAIRRFAIALLICEAGLFSIGTIAAAGFHFPLSLYYAEVIHAPFLLSFLILCLMVCFRALGIFLYENIAIKLVHRLSGRLASPLASKPWFGYFALPAVILLYALVVVPPYSDAGHSAYPPAEPASIKILEDELQLKPGGSFRGRAFVMARSELEIPQKGDMTPLILATVNLLEDHYGHILGNDHWIDLIPLNIPVINEAFHYTSAMNFFFLRNFFGRKDDVFDKAFFVLRAYDERIARMLGVRLVITDSPNLSGGALVYQTKVADAPLRIFRLDNPNLGQYSPTHLRRVATAAEALAALKDPTFDPTQDALVEESLSTRLVPGKLLSLTVDKGPTLHVQAESSEGSLLVLPFEYSHCLRVESESKSANDLASPVLLPVNLQQTGLLFDRHADVRIAYRFGPLDQPGCRREDLARIDRLRLREAFR